MTYLSRWKSISLLGLLFCSLSLVLCSDQKLMSLMNSASEVLIVREEPLEINDILIKESTRNDWGEFITVYSLDGLINAITNECSSSVTLKLIKGANIKLWKWQHLRRTLLWNLLIEAHLLLLSHWILEHLVALLLSWLLTSRKCLMKTHLLLLVTHWFVIAILLLLRHILLLLLRMRILTRLVLTLAIVTSTSTSSASVITTASASIIASSFILPIDLVVIIASALLLAIHCLVWCIHFALIHDKIDQLSQTCMIFFFLLILKIILRLPKINFDWSLVKSEGSWFIKHLDTFLCSLNIFI